MPQIKNYLLATAVTVITLLTLFACGQSSSPQNTASEVHPATSKINQNSVQELAIDDQQDFIDANRGLVAEAKGIEVRKETGELIWSTDAYDFVQGDAPATANPSLWRQEKLNRIAGLFKVTEGIYQLRGFDLANMTILEGETGWVLVDPLTSKETAATALAFARKHLEAKPITGIIFTHAHIDHFGGALGVVSKEEAQTIPIIAPSGFMEAATSENIVAGVAMGRRAILMYGRDVDKSPTGQIGSGLGKMPAFGSFGILQPNDIISRTVETRIIDGIEFEFQNAPGSEAPAELTFYLPQSKVFMAAELISRNMHNLYTLRGAQVRDALVWSHYIDEALQLFGDKSDIYIASHHWPMWGKQSVKELLTKQRDLYKYIHDQSVRMINEGASPQEIAHQIELPDSLSNYFPNRGYYGSVQHNAKAVYQYYMGWYDANPANLHPLPNQQTAGRYIDLMGGKEKVMQAAQTVYEEGDFLWLAELLNKLVFAEPDYAPAKELLAKAYQQLAYQAESGPWRNVYLSAAHELINGAPREGVDMRAFKDLLLETPVENFFVSMAVRLNAQEAEDVTLTVRVRFTDLNQSYDLSISNSVLHHHPSGSNTPDAELVLTHPFFVNMLTGDAGVKDMLFSDDLETQGSLVDLITFFSLFEKPTGTFNIVEP